MIPKILVKKLIPYANETSLTQEPMNDNNIDVVVLSFNVAISLLLILCKIWICTWLCLMEFGWIGNEDDAIDSVYSADQPGHNILHDAERTAENALDQLSFGNNDPSHPSLNPRHRRLTI